MRVQKRLPAVWARSMSTRAHGDFIYLLHIQTVMVGLLGDVSRAPGGVTTGREGHAALVDLVIDKRKGPNAG